MTAYQIYRLTANVLFAETVLQPGWKIKFFLTGTSTPVDVWTTSALNVAHDWPVEADAAGVLPVIYLDPTVTYKTEVYDQNDVLQPEYGADPANEQLLSQSIIGELLYPQTQAEIDAGVTPTNYSYEPGDIRRYGTNTTPGTTDMTAALNSALLSNDAGTVTLQGEVYAVVGASGYTLTVPASIRIVGVQGVTIIRLLSSATDTNMLGRAGASSEFYMEGVTLDGNKATVSAVNVNGLYLPEANRVISRRNTYKNLNDTGSEVGGTAIYTNNTTLCELLESSGDTFADIEAYCVNNAKTLFNIFRDATVSGIIKSCLNINGQTVGLNALTKTSITNNVISCDSSFSSALSVLSLLGDDIECTGNKINGGGTQIVVHDQAATSLTLRNYLVSGNFLWNAKGDAIQVNQTSATYGDNYNQSVVVTDNHIYQPAGSGISAIGAYVGSGSLLGSLVIGGNVITDGLTTSPAPEQYAGIRLQGVTNVSVDGNTIIAPRWAGVLAHYDGFNISITDNVIVEHQGRTTTGSGGATPQAGGAIFVGGGSATVALSNVNITGNAIQNYATAVSPQAAYVRTGGIVVNEAKVTDVSIKNNRIMTGNTVGIALLSSVNVVAESNTVSGAYSAPLLVTTPGAGYQLTYAIDYPRIGTTGNRPVLTAEQGGFNYWDTTIPEPVWWNGTNWKNEANGTV